MFAGEGEDVVKGGGRGGGGGRRRRKKTKKQNLENEVGGRTGMVGETGA